MWLCLDNSRHLPHTLYSTDASLVTLNTDVLPFSSVRLSTTHIASWKYWPFGLFALICTQTGTDYYNLTSEMPLKPNIHFNFCPAALLKRASARGGSGIRAQYYHTSAVMTTFQ